MKGGIYIKPVGILSDIHGNIEALKEVLENAEVEKWYCLGDIVGYNSSPRECVEKIREIEAHTIAGNHDRAVTGNLDLNWFNATARTALKWTVDRLSTVERSFLNELETTGRCTIGEFEVLLAHGSPDPESPFRYLLSPGDIRSIFPFMKKFDILFVGHTHVAGYFYRFDKESWNFKPAPGGCRIKLQPGKKYIVNVGSIGQPRDGNPQASFALFYPGQKEIIIKRVEYNIGTVQERIIEAGLPESLASRLKDGR
ncbi:MAG: metallophosphoesterase family protein [Halanaerobiaceae bacterium]